MAGNFDFHEKREQPIVDTLEDKRLQEYVWGFRALRDDAFKDYECLFRAGAYRDKKTGARIVTIQAVFIPPESHPSVLPNAVLDLVDISAQLMSEIMQEGFL